MQPRLKPLAHIGQSDACKVFSGLVYNIEHLVKKAHSRSPHLRKWFSWTRWSNLKWFMFNRILPQEKVPQETLCGGQDARLGS